MLPNKKLVHRSWKPVICLVLGKNNFHILPFDTKPVHFYDKLKKAQGNL